MIEASPASWATYWLVDRRRLDMENYLKDAKNASQDVFKDMIEAVPAGM
jgi:hypothetical protein